MLSLSQTTGYAIKAMSFLEGPGGKPKLMRDVARLASVPGPYLAKRMQDLVGSGLVLTKRGHRGGLLLARPPEQISLLEISEAVENRVWLEGCLLGLEQCSDKRACPTHAFWKKTRGKIEQHLRETTLAEVAQFEKTWLSSHIG